MSKRRRKGFYIDGEFVTAAPDSESGPPSRTSKKKASERLQALGEQLVDAKPGLADSLPLPDALKDAIVDARSMTSQGAKRRQRQYVGKLMRRLDDEDVDAIRAALGIQD